MDTGSPSTGPASFTYHYIRPPGRVATFTADLIGVSERMISMEMLLHRARPLVVRGEEVMREGDRLIWFLPRDEGWDIAAVFRPDSGFVGYYVDVLDPVHWQGNDPGTLLPIVDLFLDLWIAPNGASTVLDEDEFAEAVEKGWISESQRDHAQRVLADLEARVRTGQFPPAEVRAVAKL